MMPDIANMLHDYCFVGDVVFFSWNLVRFSVTKCGQRHNRRLNDLVGIIDPAHIATAPAGAGFDRWKNDN